MKAQLLSWTIFWGIPYDVIHSSIALIVVWVPVSLTGWAPINRDKASTTTKQWVFELLLGRSGPLWWICVVLKGVVSSSPHCSNGASCRSCLFVLLVWHLMQSSIRYAIHLYRTGQKKYCLTFSKVLNTPEWSLYLWVWAKAKSGRKAITEHKFSCRSYKYPELVICSKGC